MNSYSMVGIRCKSAAFDLIHDFLAKKLGYKGSMFCLTDHTKYIRVNSINEKDWAEIFTEIKKMFTAMMDRAPKKYGTVEIAVFEFKDNNFLDTWYIGDRAEEWIDMVEVKVSVGWDAKMRGR